MIAGAEVFLDTNVLIYAALGKLDAPEKFQAARRIVLDEDYGTSAQVLAEFYVNALRKGGAAMTPEKATEWVKTIARKPCQAIDAEIVEAGIAHAQRHQISYWDGAIIAAAQRLGARTLYTEDLNHGQTFDGLKVINPFLNM